MANPRALVIEDDHDVAELYGHVLHSLGFDNEIIQTGEAASARLAAVAPSIVLLDLNLPPRVSGADVLRQIRGDRRLAETRVIVLTGHPDLADTIRDEADLVLFKPVDIERLGELISDLQQGAHKG